MPSDAPHLSGSHLRAARTLQRTGQWEDALELIAGDDAAPAGVLRAQILVDRHSWRLDPADEALAAIRAISDRPALATMLTAQMEYWRRLWELGDEPLMDATSDEDVLDAFGEAAADDSLYGWAMFWRGVSAENLLEQTDRAASSYLRAVTWARAEGDLFLESYAVRHQGYQLLETDREQGLAMLRRSMNLRASLGARPTTAAAQATLAEALGDTPEAAELRELSSATAIELDLTWLKTWLKPD